MSRAYSFFMEGLKSAHVKWQMVHSLCSWQHISKQCVLLLPPRVKRRVLISPLKSQKLMNSIVAFVQPLEALEIDEFHCSAAPKALFRPTIYNTEFSRSYASGAPTKGHKVKVILQQ